MEQLLTFIIVCPLAGIAGFVDSIAGGGGLISLPAFFMAGLPAHAAIGTNKLSSTMGTTLATIRMAMKGYIKPKLVIAPVVAGLIGSSIGAGLNLLIDDGILRIIMVVVLPLTAIYVMQPHSMQESVDRLPLGKTLVFSTAVALLIGAYDGFYGPGTGTFLLLLLTGAAKMTLNDAAGTTKSINLSTNVAALVVYLANGQAWILLGLVAGACNMIGNYIGVNLLSSKGAKIVKPIMLCVIGIFLVKTLLELAGAV